MKREYVRPTASVECFAANEYVAACWSIQCNVPYGYGYFDNNKNGKYDSGVDTYIAEGSGCGTAHEANGISASGPAANAKWHAYYSSNEDMDVFYFKAKGNHWGDSNHHFCTLDSVVWQPRPNAS